MSNSVENISLISIKPKEKVADVRVTLDGKTREMWVTTPDSKWKREVESDPESGIDDEHPFRALIISKFPPRGRAEQVIKNVLNPLTDEQIEAVLELEDDEDISDSSSHITPHAA